MLALLLAPLALAAPDLSVSAGYVATRYAEDIGTYKRNGLELGATLPRGEAWELEGGLRWVMYRYTAPPPLELYVAGRAAPTLGPWHPAVGLEVGVTSALRRDLDAINEVDPENAGMSNLRWRAASSPLYGQVLAEPLRFRVWRVEVSALGVGLGTMLPGFGELTRIELSWLRVEVPL